MNRLKSIFISISATAWAYFSYLFVREIIAGNSLALLLGLFLTSIIPLGFFSILLSIKPWARTSRSLLILTLLIAAGAVFTLLEVNQQSLPFYYQYVAIASIVMWLIYVYWYSVLPTRFNELKIGATLPELTFLNEENNFYILFRRKKDALYVLYG